jgi:hypothetical protein|tara:strand:- start:49 stop:426 length:378 start_codon:yes stop_codon:yes gene_type:complete
MNKEQLIEAANHWVDEQKPVETINEAMADTELEVFTKFLDMLVTKSKGKPDGHEIMTYKFKKSELEKLLKDKPLADKLTSLKGTKLIELEQMVKDKTESRTKKDIENLYIYPKGKSIDIEIQYDY